MRYPGEDARRAPGQRQNPRRRPAPPADGPAAGQPAGGGNADVAALFAPGYSGTHPAGHEPATAKAGGGWHGSSGTAAGKGPVRGYPPAPGQPPPLYPPGQFSAWNRTTPQDSNGLGPGPADMSGGPFQADRDGGPGASGDPQTSYGSAGYAESRQAAGYADTGYPDTGRPQAGYAGRGYADARHADPGAQADRGHADSGHSGAGQADAGYQADAEYADAGYQAGAGYSDAGYADAEYANAGYAYPGYGDVGFPDPDYPALAVSDPAADVTTTQSWGVVDDSPPGSGWPDLDALREPGNANPPGDASPPGPAGPRHGRAYSPDEPHAGTDPLGDQAASHGRRRVSPAGNSATGAAWRAADSPGRGAADYGFSRGPDTSPGPVTGPGRGPASPGPGNPAPSTAGRRASRGPGSRGSGSGSASPGPITPTGISAPGATTAAGMRPAPAPAHGLGGRGQGGRGHGTRGRPRPRRSRQRTRTALACGLAVIVGIGVVAYVLFSGGQKPSAATASQRSAASAGRSRPSASPSPPLGPWGYIASRALDPAPLTLPELFPAQFANAGTSYLLTVDKAQVHCASAVIGSQLISAVNQADCTQVMRASYLSSDNELMGTIGVLNLVTATAAENAGKAAGPSEFIAQLPAAKGPTRELTKGTGIEAAEVKGHYLVLVWAELANLHAPTSGAQRAQLESFISLLIQQTANVSLATRMVTGSPPS